MIDALPDGVLVLDADRRITEANRAVEKITGYDRTELIGQDCGLLEPRTPHGKRLLDGGWHLAARLPAVRGLTEQLVTLRRKDGTEAEVAVTGSYSRDQDGGVTGAVLCLRRAERHHRPDLTGIEIVSTVSHELRSPLTSVKGYTSLMLNRWDRLRDEQKQMMLEQVNHDADRVTRLITELLDISRLESGRLVLRRQMVDLPRLASSVVDKVRLEYPELEDQTTFPSDFPKVYADADKIEQVLTNLVENACKYGSQLGLSIEGAARDGWVSVSVTDRGEGIPESDLPKVFNKFFRRAVGRPTGSGLGLWISRGLVESHGGELSAESILGHGSTFRFTLPQVDLDELQSQ
jgi:PAS domain S-box-containing protein